MITKNVYDNLVDITLRNNKELKVLYNIRNVNITTDTIIIVRKKVPEDSESYEKYINNEYLMIQLPKRKNVIYDSDVEDTGEEMGSSLHIYCYKRGICILVTDLGISYNNIDYFYNLIENIFKCKVEEYHPHYDVDKNNEFTETHNFKPEFLNAEDIETIKKYGETRIHFMCNNKSFDEMYKIIDILSKY